MGNLNERMGEVHVGQDEDDNSGTNDFNVGADKIQQVSVSFSSPCPFPLHTLFVLTHTRHPKRHNLDIFHAFPPRPGFLAVNIVHAPRISHSGSPYSSRNMRR